MKDELDRTYRSEHNKLLGFVRSRVSSREDAEDILQDVYIGAVKAMNSVDPIDNLMGWLYRSLQNRIIDWYRRKRDRTIPLDAVQDESLSLGQLLKESGINIEVQYLRKMVIEELMTCIERLPDVQREVIIRQAIEGESFASIAETTEVSINTLLARKRYAVKTLRKRLEKMKKIIDEVAH